MKGHGIGVCLVLRCLAEQALLARGWAWAAGPDYAAANESDADEVEGLTDSVAVMDV